MAADFDQSSVLRSDSKSIGINNVRLDALIAIQESIAARSVFKAGDYGFISRSVVLATMPHGKQVGNEFKRTNGLFSMTILAPSNVGLPYGAKPRLILAFLITEAVRTKSRDVVLGDSLSQFMKKIGLKPTGGRWGSITGLKDQMTRLFSSSIHCQWDGEDSSKIANMPIVSNSQLWWDHKKAMQGSLWKSTVRLGEDFYNDAIAHPIPIDLSALSALKQSSMALDIYFSLTYRASYNKNPFSRPIPWSSLQKQFGSGYPETVQGTKDFIKKYTKHLRQVLVVYPAAKVVITPKGLILKPSPTHVPKRIKE